MRCFLKRPTKGQRISAIHQGHQWEDHNSMQAIGYTDSFQLQKYPQEIPNESEGKTRHDGCEGRCVWDSLSRMLSYLCWWDREDTESPYGRAQEGSEEQGSQEWLQGSLWGRTTGEGEGFLKPLRSNKEDQWWTLLLVWFCIHHRPPLFAKEVEVMWPTVLRQEGILRGTSTCWWRPSGSKRPKMKNPLNRLHFLMLPHLKGLSHHHYMYTLLVSIICHVHVWSSPFYVPIILYIMELRHSVFLGPFRILRGVPYS